MCNSGDARARKMAAVSSMPGSVSMITRFMVTASSKRSEALVLHSCDRQGKFGTFTRGFVDDQQPPCSVTLQLLIRVQKFNTVDSPVRGHIHDQLVAYPYSLHVSSLLLKANVRDV